VLYRAVPGEPPRPLPGDGTMVSLGQRITMVTVALVGLLYYFTQRSNLQEILEEAEEMEEE